MLFRDFDAFFALLFYFPSRSRQTMNNEDEKIEREGERNYSREKERKKDRDRQRILRVCLFPFFFFAAAQGRISEINKRKPFNVTPRGADKFLFIL